MVAADDKEDEDDEVDHGEEVRQGDGPPVVAEELCEHCTMQSCTMQNCKIAQLHNAHWRKAQLHK